MYLKSKFFAIDTFLVFDCKIYVIFFFSILAIFLFISISILLSIFYLSSFLIILLGNMA